MREPSAARLSRKMGEVTPKLPSESALFQTLWESERFGNSPLSLAIPHGTVTAVVTPVVVVGTATVVLPFGPPAHPRGTRRCGCGRAGASDSARLSPG